MRLTQNRTLKAHPFRAGRGMDIGRKRPSVVPDYFVASRDTRERGAQAEPMKKRARGSGAASGPRRGGSTGAKKKLVIRALKAPPKLPDDFADKTWAALQSAVRAVYAGSPIEASREELYRMVHDLCTNKKAQWLYGQLKAEVDAHAGSLVGDLRQRTPDTTAFLALVQATWRRFTEQMLAIRSTFLHLDRSYVLHLGSVKSLWDMATQLFCAHFEAASEVADKSVQGMLALVARERQGESVDHGLLASLSRMLQSLHIYKSALEPRLLDESRSFYDAEGKRLIESTDAAHYLQLVDSRMQSEAQRVRAYLDPETRKPLIQVLDDWLLQPHLGAIVDKGEPPRQPPSSAPPLTPPLPRPRLCPAAGRRQDRRPQPHVLPVRARGRHPARLHRVQRLHRGARQGRGGHAGEGQGDGDHAARAQGRRPLPSAPWRRRVRHPDHWLFRVARPARTRPCARRSKAPTTSSWPASRPTRRPSTPGWTGRRRCWPSTSTPS